MMKAKFTIVAASVGLLFAALPMLAHHSFAAEYDGTKPLTLKGTVTKVDWVNPHSWIHIDVKDADGKVVNWSCETAPPNSLYRAGWRRDSVKPGDEVIIEGFPAKDQSATLNARTVKLPDGRRLFAGTPSDGGPQGNQSENNK